MDCSSLIMDCEDLSHKTSESLKMALEKHIQTLSLVDSDAKSLESGIASLNSECSFSHSASYENPSLITTNVTKTKNISKSLDLSNKPSHKEKTAENETRREKNQESTGVVISDGLFKVPGHRNTGYAGEVVQKKSPVRHRPIRQAFPDKDGDTLLHIAALQQESQPSVSSAASDAASVTDRPHRRRLNLAALVRALGLRHDDVNTRNRRHQTPLHLAVAAANHGAIAELLTLGASLMAQDWRGDTPLHGACRRRDFRALLVLMGRDKNGWSNDEETKIIPPTTVSAAASFRPSATDSDHGRRDSPPQPSQHRTNTQQPTSEKGNRKDLSASGVLAHPPTTKAPQTSAGSEGGSAVEPNPPSRGSSESGRRSMEPLADTDCAQVGRAFSSTILLLDRDHGGVNEGVKTQASGAPLEPGLARQDDVSSSHKRRSKHPGYAKENLASSNLGFSASPYARPHREVCCKLQPSAPDSSGSLSSPSLFSSSSSSSDSFSLREVYRTPVSPLRVLDPVVAASTKAGEENAGRRVAAAARVEELRQRALDGRVLGEHEPVDAPIYRQRSWRDQEARAALSVVNYDGLTCLHLAVLSSDCGLVQLLLTCGADANAKDGKSGRTALHFAVDCPQPDLSVLAALLRHPQLQVDAANFARQTALQLARGRLHLHLLPMLQARGARWSDASSDLHCSSDSCCSDEEMEEAFPEHYDELCQAEKLSAILRQW